MRLSPSYYPEYVRFTCTSCWTDNVETKVDSIEDDSVVARCEVCGEETYVRVID